MQTLNQTPFFPVQVSFSSFFLRLSNEISTDRNKTTSVTIIMRRHTADPESIGRQIISLFTSPTRKLLNLTNNNNGNSIIKFSRRSRRYSVPEKKKPDRLDINPELQTIQEVSQ
jgi:hypothetical protein